MNLFTIQKTISLVDNYFYLEFFPEGKYSDKAKTCLLVYDPNVDEQPIRENLFIILNEQYPEFKNEYYL